MDNIYEGTFFIIKKETIEKRKTPIYHIFSWDGPELGVIKWYQSWRKYCFYPNGDTIWDRSCIVSVIKFMDKLNEEHKENLKKP